MNENEYFVDESKNPIPNRQTWDTLSVNELIDVKILLENKLQITSNSAAIKIIQHGLAELTNMISARSF